MEYSLLFYAVVLLPLAQSLTDTGLIEFINSNQSSWIAGMNFHNQTKEEILPLFHGVLGLHPDPNFTVPMVTHNIDQTTIPVNFDARNTWPYCANIIGNIRNQGTCGSCWVSPIFILPFFYIVGNFRLSQWPRLCQTDYAYRAEEKSTFSWLPKIFLRAVTPVVTTALEVTLGVHFSTCRCMESSNIVYLCTFLGSIYN